MDIEVLIIEDDLKIQKGIVEYLRDYKIKCTCTDCIEKARALVEKYYYQVVLLDLDLPDGSGLEYITSIKSIWNESCVIIISASDKLEDRVDGLHLGADDYLTKPFHLAELNARIHAVLRRNFTNLRSTQTYEDITINTITNNITISGKEVDFSRKEYDLLLFFLENRNRVLTKENLFEHVWGENSVFMESSDFIYTMINRVRKKIKSYTGSGYIKTVHGFGYKLDAH